MSRLSQDIVNFMSARALDAFNREDKESEAIGLYLSHAQYPERLAVRPDRILETINEGTELESADCRRISVAPYRKNVHRYRIEVLQTAEWSLVRAKADELDEYLATETFHRPGLKEQLSELLDILRHPMAHGILANPRGSLILQELDLVVQIARTAHSNTREFTYLLAYGEIPEIVKVDLRKYLRFSEKVSKSALGCNANYILKALKQHAFLISKELALYPSGVLTQSSELDGVQLKEDFTDLFCYLQDLLLLRYEHIPRGVWRSKIRAGILRPLADYITWNETRDGDIAMKLAKRCKIHPIELDRVFQRRLNRLLGQVDIDASYVKARLADMNDPWLWAHRYNTLADKAQWKQLAKQFLDDRAQFEKIFPGRVIYIDPANGVYFSNAKARVKTGMMLLHGHFFSKLRPGSYERRKDIGKLEKTNAKVLRAESKQQRKWRPSALENLETVKKTPPELPKTGSDMSDPLSKSIPVGPLDASRADTQRGSFPNLRRHIRGTKRVATLTSSRDNVI
ncbi:MAG: hypothetical protein Q9220_000217 [cf. Caloplaca sp. 1 TL-2023]